MVLNATQPFDRIHYIEFFNTLIAHSMCFVIVLLLMYIYCNHIVNVKWDNSVLDSLHQMLLKRVLFITNLI